MKLIVTIGNAQVQTEELVFELDEPIIWMGVEIEDTRPEEDRSSTGRMTILRVPFANDGENIHTTCCPDPGAHE